MSNETKTVRVRIAVAVDPKGEWNCCGGSWAKTDADKMDLCVETLADGEARYWIEADVQVPTAPVITPSVTNA